MAIRCNTYKFHCVFTSDSLLPGYLGSTLRGALGWALKKVSCALKRQQCAACILREQCNYAWLFETERYQGDGRRAVNARPHPFVLRPAGMLHGKQQRNTSFTFSLLLLGRANDLLPHLIYAVKLMGDAGIGSGRRHGMGHFRLEKVTRGDVKCFDHSEQIVCVPEDSDLLQLEAPIAQAETDVTVQLATPLRLKKGNRLQPDLPFHVLIRAILRRLTALEIAYGQGEPSLDYSGLVIKAKRVKILESKIRWQELYRYSNRQRQKVSLSGLGGTIRYQGDFTEFLSLLHYGEKVNIGKQTAFGLGRIELIY